MFCNDSNVPHYISSVDLSDLDFSEMISANYMFKGCTSLTSLDTSTWNISKLKYAASMFHGCSGLTSLDCSSWDTSNLIVIRGMFRGCSTMTTLDIRSWDLSNVAAYAYGSLFENCSALTTIIANGKVIEQLKTLNQISSSDTFADATIYQLSGSISNGVFTVSSYTTV